MKHKALFSLILFGSFLFSQDYQTDIQPIFSTYCTPACHNPNNLTGGLNLTDGQSYGNLVNVPSQGYTGFQRAVPFDTMNSVLYQKIMGNPSFGAQMPKNATPLPQTERDKIGNWIVNGALETSGETSFSFDYGFGGHIETSSPIDGQQTWSIEFWLTFHQQPTGGVQEIFNRNRSDNTAPDIFFQYDGTIGKFRFFIENGGQDEESESAAFDNQFHHYYFEGDGSKVRWYFDGHLEGELTMTASFPTSTNKMIFGNGLDGSMDEVRFRTLSGFSAVPTAPYSPEAGTVLLWHFDTQSPTVVEDASGFNNQGTIVGTSAYTEDVYFGFSKFFAWLNGNVVEMDWDKWDQSGGTFGRYEIHRAQTPGVTTASPLLVSITEIDTTHFVDTTPPQGDVFYKLFVMDPSSNILADYGEVYVNTTFGGGGGINVDIGSSATTSGLLMVGLMNPSVDANYWTNRSQQWVLGNFNFPGDFQFVLPTGTAPDSNDYRLMAFVDLNGDSTLDDVTEAYGISAPFNITGGKGDAGSINMDFQGGGFTVTVDLQEDWPFGQLYIGLYKEGDNLGTDPAIYQEQIGVDPPFNQDVFIPQELPGGIQYFLWGFYDANGNMMPDSDEPGGVSNLCSYPPSSPVFLHLMTGPEIDTSGVTSVTAEEGVDLVINVDIISSSGVNQAALHYWVGNAGNEKVVNMTQETTNSWQGTIPGSDVTPAGLIVYVRAQDNNNVTTATASYSIPVTFNTLDIKTTRSEEYTMISVPGNLNDPSISAVLEPDLGSPDPTVWRLFQWNGSDYVENQGSFGPFEAFWIITKDAHLIVAGSGSTMDLANPVIMNLSDGWNMVGTPYYFPVDFLGSNVMIQGSVEAALYNWNGSSYDVTTNFQPGEGYWLYSNGGGSVSFYFGHDIKLARAVANKTVVEDGLGWQAALSVSLGEYQDRGNIFGEHPDAADERDARDFHEPPVIGAYVSLAFENEGWQRNRGRYRVDIRTMSPGVKSWELGVRSSMKGVATITLDDLDRIPPQSDIMLVDRVQGIAYDLRKNPNVTFASPGEDQSYPFLLLVGERSALDQQMGALHLVPDQFELSQNTPNPFNPVTTIGISLTQDALVTLRVFNILGQELNVLALNQPMTSGRHRFIWTGKDARGNSLPSGVYLYRLEVKDHTGRFVFGDTKKMLLVK